MYSASVLGCIDPLGAVQISWWWWWWWRRGSAYTLKGMNRKTTRCGRVRWLWNLFM